MSEALRACENPKCEAGGALASGVWRLRLRPKGRKVMRLCAACGFAAHGWRRFTVLSRKDSLGRAHETCANVLYVKSVELVRTLH